jgi:hypothetical protein
MGFYTALESVNGLMAGQQWRLHRCRRNCTDTLHYYITDNHGRVITPTSNRRRIGLTLDELLTWLEQGSSNYLARQARELRRQIIESA